MPRTRAFAALALFASWWCPAAAEEVDLARAATTSAFVDGIGVNTHLTWLDSVYADPALVERLMAYLGVRHIRDTAPPQWGKALYRRLAAKGCRFDFFIPVNDGAVDVEGSLRRAAELEADYPGSVAMIEGPNEVNNWPAPYKGGSDLPSAAALQRDLYAMVKESPVLRHVPVAPLTLAGASVADFAPLGDLSAAADFANAHVYFPGGSQPSGIWSWALASNATPTPNLPSVVTETGYYDLPDGERGVPSDVQAKQTLNILAGAAAGGVRRTYLYQLIDNFPDRQDDPENRYGLFKASGEPKPAATAVRNLVRTLSGNDGSEPRHAGAFVYDLLGLPRGTRTLLLAGEDRTLWLVVWTEPEIWNAASRQAVVAPTSTVTLTLGEEADVDVYDPFLGADTVSRTPSTRTATIDLVDRPVLIGIRGAERSAPGR